MHTLDEMDSIQINIIQLNPDRDVRERKRKGKQRGQVRGRGRSMISKLLGLKYPKISMVEQNTIALASTSQYWT